MNFYHRKLKGKCPNCQAITAYTEVSFPATNDHGAIIAKCETCQSKFKITVKNPNESHITGGAIKIEYLDFEFEESIANAKNYNELIDKIAYNIDLNKKLNSYPLTEAPLYICNCCKNNLEELAYSTFRDHEESINKANGEAINWIMAHSRTPDYKKIIVSLDFTCACDSACVAVFYRPYNEFMQANYDEYLLADVSGALDLSERIDGVVSKTTAMDILCKLIVRWNLLSQKILIATPFVGHQHMSDDQLSEIWSSILSWLDPKKSIIYTKSATANSFKRAFKASSGIDYSMLVEYELGNSAFDNAKRKNDFHAKFFAGISENSSEIMSGSANLLPGPSFENINFRRYKDYSTLYNRYLSPFGISDLGEALPQYDEYSIIIKKNSADLYKWSEVTFSEYAYLKNRTEVPCATNT